MVRQVFHSGYCFVVPHENERELIKEYIDEEFLKLGIDRIPAVGDIRYYDKFDRYGNIIEKNHFIIEEVTNLIVERINKVSGFDDNHQWHERTEIIIKVSYKVALFKEKAEYLWEQLPLMADV